MIIFTLEQIISYCYKILHFISSICATGTFDISFFEHKLKINIKFSYKTNRYIYVLIRQQMCHTFAVLTSSDFHVLINLGGLREHKPYL